MLYSRFGSGLYLQHLSSGGECGVFAQTEDRRWVHRNGGRERVSVCGCGRVKAEAVALCWSDWPLLFSDHTWNIKRV